MYHSYGWLRCTLRNRRFLRCILPVCADRPIHITPKSPTTPTSHTPCAAAQPPSQRTPATQALTPKHIPSDIDAPALPTPLRAANSAASAVPHRRLHFENASPPLIAYPTVVQPILPNMKPRVDPPRWINAPVPDNIYAESVIPSPTPAVRRSTRVRQPKRNLSPSMTGKSHDYFSS